jgi:hypothetical protein
MDRQYKFKIRLDYMSSKPSKGFFSGKNAEDLAEDLRQNKVSSLRNVPIQGVIVEEIDMSQDVYVLHDDVTSRKQAFAPVTILLSADSVEDILPLVMLDEFRTVQVLEPKEWNLTHLHIEKILFKINEELMEYRKIIERKFDNWK